MGKMIRQETTSPKVLLQVDTGNGVGRAKHLSGKFSLRVDPAPHEATAIAAVQGQSLNQGQRMRCGRRRGLSPSSLPRRRPSTAAVVVAQRWDESLALKFAHGPRR
jgi:hypothetical protein